jgi:hypothetical protein
MSIAAHETKFQFPWLPAVGLDTRERKLVNELRAELLAARAREAALLREKQDLSQRQVMLAQEFEHRLLNGLQLIVSLLSLQSRAASTPEVAVCSIDDCGPSRDCAGTRASSASPPRS